MKSKRLHAKPLVSNNADSAHDSVNNVDTEAATDSSAEGVGKRRASTHRTVKPFDYSRVRLTERKVPAATLTTPSELTPGNAGITESGELATSTVPAEIIAMIKAHRAKADEIANTTGTAPGFSGVAYPEAVVLAIEREWVAGVRSVLGIANAYGLSRSTVLFWARSRGWPPRATFKDSVRAQIDESVIEKAVSGFRSLSSASSGLDESGATAPAGSEMERAEAIVSDYANIVANVVQAMRDTSGDAVGTGRTLLEGYKQSLEALMAGFKPNDKAAAMKVLGPAASVYRTIVQALHTAYQLQRQAYGLDVVDPQGANPGAGPEQMGGTYEDAVRAAEARGVLLS
jgi:hypothetical protein